MKELVKIPASSLERVMRCAGSPRFENVIKFEQDEDAKDGEAWEELLSMMVANGTDEITATHSSKGAVFTKEMYAHARRMFPYIPKGSQYQIDTSWMTIKSGVKMSGRLDWLKIHDDTDTLEVIDAKYGHHVIEAVEFWQGIDYAIGIVLQMKRAFKNIKITIVQPRPHHEDGPVRSWTISYQQLLEYHEEIERRVAGMKNNMNTELVAGEHCKYCKAGDSGVCPAKNKTFFNAVNVTMTELKQDVLSEEDISYMLDLYKQAETNLKIQKKSLEDLAKSRIKSNKLIPNYTLVDVIGHREWNPEMNEATIKILTGKDATVNSMLTPAQFEAEYNVPEMLMNAITKRPHRGSNLKRKDSGKIADEVFKNLNTKKV